MKYLIRKNMRFGTTRITCQDEETARVFLASPIMYEALKKIATCESFVTGDVVDIANQALAQVGEGVKRGS